MGVDPAAGATCGGTSDFNLSVDPVRERDSGSLAKFSIDFDDERRIGDGATSREGGAAIADGALAATLLIDVGTPDPVGPRGDAIDDGKLDFWGVVGIDDGGPGNFVGGRADEGVVADKGVPDPRSRMPCRGAKTPQFGAQSKYLLLLKTNLLVNDC